MASLFISSHIYFSLPTYHGIDQNLQSPFISVCRHIKASINNTNHHLFWYASISWHYMITLVIDNSGSVIYRDIYLKTNNYHISSHIQTHRVFRHCQSRQCRWDIAQEAKCQYSPRGISVIRHCRSKQCRWDIAQEAKCRYSPSGISVFRHSRSRQCRWDIAQEAKCRYIQRRQNSIPALSK
jgi:hypothetical protein